MNCRSEEKTRKPDYTVKRTGLLRKLVKELEYVQLVQAMTKVLYDVSSIR